MEDFLESPDDGREISRSWKISWAPDRDEVRSIYGAFNCGPKGEGGGWWVCCNKQDCIRIAQFFLSKAAEMDDRDGRKQPAVQGLHQQRP